MASVRFYPHLRLRLPLHTRFRAIACHFTDSAKLFAELLDSDLRVVSNVVAGVPLVDWLSAMLRTAPFPEHWRFLDGVDTAETIGITAALSSRNVSQSGQTVWIEEENRIACVEHFIADIGEAWRHNLTASNKHLYLQKFRNACPCPAGNARALPYDIGC